jgi:anionic cell wall polymer biosynthesis LytR-Cps2A-Psr (LCP) family protein
MRKTKTDASFFFLGIIGVFLAGGIIFAFLHLRSDPLEDSIAENRVINTLFIIENEEMPLASYVLMYYPATKRAAVFDIPGSLGLIIERIDRVDRIDTIYESRRTAPFEHEIENLLGVDISFSIVFDMEKLVKIVDLIEGVEIFIPSPVEVYQDNPILFPSGVTRLDGDKARLYISYELPDENRELVNARRQHFFLRFIRRLGERNDSLHNPKVAQVYRSFFRTAMNRKTLERLFDEFAGIDMDRVNIQAVGGNLKEVSGQDLILPHWDGNLIKEIVRQSLGALVRPAEGSLSERVFTVAILNGTAVNGLANRTAELFRSFGYDVISVNNADRNDYPQTRIIDHSGLEEAAGAFADIIRCKNISYDILAGELEESDINIQNFDYRSDFTLIIGRDFNGRYVTN